MSIITPIVNIKVLSVNYILVISLPTFPIFGGWNFKASFLTRVSLVSGRVGRIAATAVAKAIAVVCAAWRTWQMPGEHSAMDCCQRSPAATQATGRTVAWASNRTVSWVNGPNGANVVWPCNGNGNGTFSSQPDWGGCPVWGRCIRRRPVNQRQWIVWSQIGPTGMSAIRAVVPPKPGVNGPSPSSPSMGGSFAPQIWNKWKLVPFPIVMWRIVKFPAGWNGVHVPPVVEKVINLAREVSWTSGNLVVMAASSRSPRTGSAATPCVRKTVPGMTGSPGANVPSVVVEAWRPGPDRSSRCRTRWESIVNRRRGDGQGWYGMIFEQCEFGWVKAERQ